MSRRVRFLIDECLHTSLVKVATDRFYEAYHVAHLGLSGLKDHELMSRVRDEDFTFVTNNAIDFRRLFGKEQIHPGLVIFVPNVVPIIQRALFASVLEYLGDRDLVNRAIEINLSGDTAEIEDYEIPLRDGNVNDIIKKLKVAQRRKVEVRAAQLIAEEMTLREVRSARKLTLQKSAKARLKPSPISNRTTPSHSTAGLPLLVSHLSDIRIP